MTAIEILITYRAKIADPAGWTPESNGLAFWSFKKRANRKAWEEAKDRMDYSFSEVYGRSWHSFPLTDLAEHKGHDAVLALVDHAINHPKTEALEKYLSEWARVRL